MYRLTPPAAFAFLLLAITLVRPQVGNRFPIPAIMGLNHIPIAVADLDGAAAQYRQLGFALKPGRPHANGIRNEHAKFPDGS